MKKLSYYDFDLNIRLDAGNLYADVWDSPVGQAKAISNSSLSHDTLNSEAFSSLDLFNIQSAKWLGTSLFKAVFVDEIHANLRRSEDIAKNNQCGLRIRLHLNDPKLINIPWEYLYDPTFDRFLCTSSLTPITRFLDLPIITKPIFIQPPIKMLVVIASPKNYPKLNTEAEWLGIQESLGNLSSKGLIKIDKLEGASYQQLQKKLLQDTYHIVHFIGHADFDDKNQEGVLILENETGNGQQISSDALGVLLQDSSYSLRLVFLNTCKGARTSTRNQFSGIAQTLVQKGIPAVIAMQSSIFDQTAILLCNNFYPVLLQGYPVDVALAEARKAIYGLNNRVGWGNPVLYMRVSDGKILDLSDKPQHRISSVQPNKKESFQQLLKADPFASIMFSPGGGSAKKFSNNIKQLGLLGLLGAGKTTFLAVFYIACQSSGWQIRASDEASHEFHLRYYKRLFQDGEFPTATRPEENEEFHFDINRKGLLFNENYRIAIGDLSGEWFQRPLNLYKNYPDVANPYYRLMERDGILLLIDPTDLQKYRSDHNLVIINFLGSLLRATNWERNQTKIHPKLAVCLTKMDMPNYRQNLHLNDQEMKSFASKVLGNTIVQEIYNACHKDKVKFFGCSSIGLEHSDNKLDPKKIQPVNVFQAVEWLLK